MPFSFTVVRADAQNLYGVATFAGGLPAALPAAMFDFGGAVYQIVQDINRFYRVFHSVNHGASWVELDAANAPSAGIGLASAGFVLDLAGSKFTISFPDLAAPPATINFADFDLALGTWGPTYALDAFPSTLNALPQLHRRPDGSLVQVATIDDVFVEVWDGVAWTSTALGLQQAPIDILEGVGSVMDPSGTVHVFAVIQDSLLTVLYLAYACLRPDGSVSPAVVIPGIDPTFGAGFMSGLGQLNPVIVGNSIHLGVADVAGLPAILVGAPLNNPSFSVSAPIDTLTPIPVGFFGGWPGLFFDGLVMWAVWVYTPDGFGTFVVRAMKTAGPDYTIDWIRETVFDTAVETAWLGPAPAAIWNSANSGTWLTFAPADAVTLFPSVLTGVWLSAPFLGILRVVFRGVRRVPGCAQQEFSAAPVGASVKWAV